MYSTQFLGLIDYEKAVDLQAQAAKGIGSCSRGIIFGLEHPAVITFGKRGDLASDLVFAKEHPALQGVSLAHSLRGGQATLHSPGQLVIYPVLALRSWGWGAKFYVDFIMRVTENVFLDLGIESFRSSLEPGIFTSGGRKICFFGVQISKGVSQHGLAINVTNDLELFKLIRSCGVKTQVMDKIQNYHPDLSLERIFELWCHHFALLFHEQRQDLIDLASTN